MLATEELIAENAQCERLAEHIDRVAARVPLYREIAARSSPGDRGCDSGQLERVPFITKEDIRRGFPRNFLGPDVELENLLETGAVEIEHTSGTSEPRTPLLLPRGWWDEQERRALNLNAFISGLLAQNPDARRVTISSPICSGDLCFTGVPSANERTIGNTLFLSLSRFPFLWGEADLARMARETVEWQPLFLDVDPVYGVVFALYCERQGVKLPSLKFILCSYEFVSVVHRRVLERVFQVPVFNLYGSTETGHLLMEDEGGRMRPSLETAYFELHDFDSRLNGRRGSEPTKLVVTTLSNEYMPLMRYRIGDLAECRREPYETSYVVHGRAADAFVSGNGRRVTTWQVDQCFEGISGIAHYQLIQRHNAPWLLRFVPSQQGPADGEPSALCERLTDMLELDIRVEVQATNALLAESSGKFRLCYPALNDSNRGSHACVSI